MDAAQPARPLKITDLRVLPGCSAGLAEPTALAWLDASAECAGAQPADAAQSRLRAGAHALFADPAFVDDDRGWPPAVPGEDCALVAGRWVVALTVALARQAGDPVWRGRVVGVDRQRVNLAVPWRRRTVLDLALDLAVRLVEQWVRPEPDPAALGALRARAVEGLAGLRPDGLPERALGFVRTAVACGVPLEMLPGAVQLGWGAAALRIRDGVDDRANVLGVSAAGNALLANQLMANALVPLPDGEVVVDLDAARRVVERVGWPVVVKPAGREASAVSGIGDDDSLAAALRSFQDVSRHGVVVEQHIDGDDHRLLVVEGRLLAAEIRRLGADPVDVTDGVHPDNRMLAERVARILGLPTLGVQVRTADIGRSWRAVGAAVCRVDARPVLGTRRSVGRAVDCDPQVIGLAFGSATGRIPTAAITGPGAATAAALVHRVWLAAGVHAGVCAGTEVRIGADIAVAGDLSGQPGGRILLTDPAVEAAVIELPSSRVQHLGHPCDRYDVVGVLAGEEQSAGQFEAVERAGGAVVVSVDHPELEGLRARAGGVRRILVGAAAAPDAESVSVADHDGAAWVVHRAGGRLNPLFPVGGRSGERLRAVLAAAAVALGHAIAPSAITEVLSR